MLPVTKNQVLKGFFWKYLERFSSQFVLFIVQIILARLLLPYDFGVVAIIYVFISVANIFVQGGLNLALIQKHNADELDFATVFFSSIFIAFIFYIIFFILSPSIALFFNEQKIILVFRVLPIVLIFGAVNSVQVAYTSRQMNFKPIFISTFVASLISGILAILFAFWDYGIWALIFQQIISYIITTIMLFYTVRWYPEVTFSFNRFKRLFSYAWKLMASSFCSFINEDSYSLAIGKVYSKELLGYYNRGYQFPSVLVISNLNGAIMSVLFPTLSSCQNDKERMKFILKKAVSVSSFFVFPAMTGLIVIADSMIAVILTDKWAQCVPYLRVESLFFATIPVLTSLGVSFNALGRSDINLKLSIVKVVMTLLIVSLFIRYGILTLLIMKVLVSLIMVLFSVYIAKRIIGYDIFDFYEDTVTSFVLSIITGFIMYSVQLVFINKYIILVTQLFIGLFFYLGVSYILKLKTCIYIIQSILALLRNRN